MRIEKCGGKVLEQTWPFPSSCQHQCPEVSCSKRNIVDSAIRVTQSMSFGSLHCREVKLWLLHRMGKKCLAVKNGMIVSHSWRILITRCSGCSLFFPQTEMQLVFVCTTSQRNIWVKPNLSVFAGQMSVQKNPLSELCFWQYTKIKMQFQLWLFYLPPDESHESRRRSRRNAAVVVSAHFICLKKKHKIFSSVCIQHKFQV